MAVKTQVKNLYEVIVVTRPNLNEDGVDQCVLNVENAIKNYGGSIVRKDEPVRKKFTHKMKNFKDGFYVSILFNSQGDLPNLLKRTLSISDEILRYIITRREGIQK